MYIRVLEYSSIVDESNVIRYFAMCVTHCDELGGQFGGRILSCENIHRICVYVCGAVLKGKNEKKGCIL